MQVIWSKGLEFTCDEIQVSTQVLQFPGRWVQALVAECLG